MTCKKLNRKKASLGKTHKNQTEANDPVSDLNRKTEKALDTLVILNARFEVVGKGLGEIEQIVRRRIRGDAELFGMGQGRSEVCRDRRAGSP